VEEEKKDQDVTSYKHRTPSLLILSCPFLALSTRSLAHGARVLRRGLGYAEDRRRLSLR